MKYYDKNKEQSYLKGWIYLKYSLLLGDVTKVAFKWF